jgi:mRNA-degrading endonuclease RelE of RelBE toxin-antitoxin system
MSFDVKYTPVFAKEFKRLVKKYPSLYKELDALIQELEEKPDTGIHLGDNLYKIRLAIGSKGTGKSGGARIITFLAIKNNAVYLASIYDKSEYSTINTAILLKKLKETFG